MGAESGGRSGDARLVSVSRGERSGVRPLSVVALATARQGRMLLCPDVIRQPASALIRAREVEGS